MDLAYPFACAFHLRTSRTSRPLRASCGLTQVVLGVETRVLLASVIEHLPQHASQCAHQIKLSTVRERFGLPLYRHNRLVPSEVRCVGLSCQCASGTATYAATLTT
jgi:hypothetical protein